MTENAGEEADRAAGDMTACGSGPAEPSCEPASGASAPCCGSSTTTAG